MRRFRIQHTVIVLISCTITIAEIEWVSSTLLRGGVPTIDNCAWVAGR